jgi:hypothetical protein
MLIGARRFSSKSNGVFQMKQGMTVSAKVLQRVVIILGIVWMAWSLRMRAVALLPIDYDEDDYLRAAQLYAKMIRNRAWQQLPEVTFNSEHPPLAKLTFGAALASLPPAPEILEHSATDPAASSLP